MITVDIHILQSVPPSNINRDDNGSPKTALYGGVRRARISSQALKRATRENFSEYLDTSELGHRTKLAASLIAERISQSHPEIADPEDRAWKVLTQLKLKREKSHPRKDEQPGPDTTQYLVFFSNPQLDRLAELAAQEEAPTANEVKAAVQLNNGIGLSLFGRMVADDAGINVDASVQVAHAISTHAVESEYDYYTAVDDDTPDGETGAGMMGLLEFNSSTLYRYATINVDGLRANLGDEAATLRAVRAFLRSFVVSMPTGKQSTFANNTLPEAVVVSVHRGRPISYVDAFESPVMSNGAGYLTKSAEQLAAHAQDIADAYGQSGAQTWVLRVGKVGAALDVLGPRLPLDELVDAVANQVELSTSEQI